MKLKAIRLLLLSMAAVLLLVGCGQGSQTADTPTLATTATPTAVPTVDIDAIVEAKVKELLAAIPTPTPKMDLALACKHYDYLQESIISKTSLSSPMYLWGISYATTKEEWAEGKINASEMELKTRLVTNETIGIITEAITLYESYEKPHLSQFCEGYHDYGSVPSANRLYRHRANLYNILEEYKKAIKDYTMAIGHKVGDVNYTLYQYPELNMAAYSSRGQAYYAIGEYTKAIDDYTKAIGLLDEDRWPMIFLLRADAHSILGQPEKAKQDRMKAERLCTLERESNSRFISPACE